MSSARLVAILIAVGMGVAFGYSLGESAGRRAAGAGVSQYQYEQMARQFSRAVSEQYAAAATDEGDAGPAELFPAPAARPTRSPERATADASTGSTGSNAHPAAAAPARPRDAGQADDQRP